MSDTLNDKQKQLISDLANDLRETVTKIEGKLATTRNHYGDYMSLIGGLAKGNRTVGQVIALALIEAGANAQGVNDALRVSF